MGWLFKRETPFAAGAPDERAISYQDLFASGADVGTGPVASSGETVTEQTALCMAAVYGAVRILADGVSTLPVQVRRGQGLAAPTLDPPPRWLIDPSPVVGKIDVWSQIMTSLLFRGNAYLFVVRTGAGDVVRLVPVHPDRVQCIPDVIPVTGGITYLVDGVERFTAFEFLHIRGLMLPGEVCGVSPLDAARETVGLGLAAQKYGATFFANSAMPSMVVEAAAEVDRVARQVMKAEWNDLHRGAGNAHKLAIFGGGATLRTIATTNEQAQFLESRNFQVQEIARIFGVPPHLLADASGSTSWGSGLAEQNQAYVTHSLRPWVERIEQAFTWLARSEAPAPDESALTVRISMEHLMRGDFSSHVHALAAAVNADLMTRDEARESLGLPPMTGPDPLDVALAELTEVNA